MEDERTPDWLDIAKDAYRSSTNYLDNNIRKQIEASLRVFQSKHPSGSKYLTDAFKFRSKGFRPKTRAAIRNNEAAATAAFLANPDAASIEAENPDDPFQLASAEINKELLNYRLSNSIPWFMTLIGAVQDAQVSCVCSYQYWEYEEKTVKRLVQMTDDYGNPVVDEDGTLQYTEVSETIPIKDNPFIKLLPVENIRFHPHADWTDPVNSSPYFIILWPMYVGDVKLKMAQTNPKTGESKWKKLTEDEIKSATKLSYDSTRQTRESSREDSTQPETTGALSDFDIVWVHENFIRKDGEEYVYLTLGCEHMLTDAVFLENRYIHGKRPVTLGVSVIETHKNYPTSLAGLGIPVQEELNDMTNQRRDNVKLVLNKRYMIRRGKQIDIQSLLDNVAGSITMVNDPLLDVKEIQFDDVTSSSYHEQDRLNLDYDELVGMFSPSTIQSNRTMNETVGGMQMLRGGVNLLTEYLLKTISESWLEPTIKQLILLEQYFETDRVILAIAAQKAQLYQRFGINDITDELLRQNLTITVNVGLGATDPMLKLERFLLAVTRYAEIEKMQMEIAQIGGQPTFNMEEIQKEIFGRLGHKDGTRFFNRASGEDPQLQQIFMQMQQMQQVIAQLQGALADKQADRHTKLLDTQLKEEGADRRKAAELRTRLREKQYDLQNPVVGERVKPFNQRAA